jgi:low temperature requirement protein LtrA
VSVSDAERELERGDEHQVTPLELFFDLVFVSAALPSHSSSETGRVSQRRTLGAVVLLALIQVALVIPTLGRSPW